MNRRENVGISMVHLENPEDALERDRLQGLLEQLLSEIESAEERAAAAGISRVLRENPTDALDI